MRIGVSTRTVHETRYEETRDAVARHWIDFLGDTLPTVLWMPIPNVGAVAGDIAGQWSLDGLILTGGPVPGSDPVRDETEFALLDHFIGSGKPVLGVCRGLQVVQAYFGGAIDKCIQGDHIGTRHLVRFVRDVGSGQIAGLETEVNSYHGDGIRIDAVAPPLIPFAVTEDGWAEGCMVADGSIIAIMWHPEREAAYAELDRRMFNHLFNTNQVAITIESCNDD